MNICYSYYSDQGPRATNEDTVGVYHMKDSLLATVADGLGGHASGAEASQLAIKTVSEYLKNKECSIQMLNDAICSANRQIIAQQESRDAMKTTVAVLWITENKTVCAYVGDSRIYQLRDGKVVFKTKDHSAAQMAVMLGEIDETEVNTYPQRNLLFKVLGGDANVAASSETLKCEKGDALLICSDGFWEKINDDEIEDMLKETSDAEQWLDSMRRLVEERIGDNGDNHSAVTLFIE